MGWEAFAGVLVGALKGNFCIDSGVLFEVSNGFCLIMYI